MTGSVGAVTRLRELYDRFGQSPWLDDLQRPSIASGELAGWIERGVRGVTSNPTIFAKAMAASDCYDGQITELLSQGMEVADAYWRLAETDVGDAADLLRPVYDRSDGADGYVSIEVSPAVANRTDETVATALEIHGALDRPNVFIKVPARAEGVPAIRRLIGKGINVNVTLIFGLDRYEAVMDAYLSGLEDLLATGGSPARIASVASFFVSRVDTEVDNRLDAIGTPEARALRGQAGIAQAQVAYHRFTRRFQGERWEHLAAAGARVQRPLWASTSTKNPAYPDTLYVDNLIGPDTVHTLHEATLGAFEDHGHLARTVDADPAGAQQVLDELTAVGIDLDDVTAKLEHEGVASFSKSFDEVMATLDARVHGLRK
jgi:transaldolase